MKLTKKEAQIIINNYGLGKISKLDRIKEGSSNYNYQIKTTKGKYILRIYLKSTLKKNLLNEIEYLSALKELNFPYLLPKPLTHKGKKSILKFNDHYLILYEFIEGKTEYPLSNKKIREVGKMMAIFHNLSQKINIPTNKKSPNDFAVDDHLRSMKEIIKEIKSKKKLNSIDGYYLNNIPEAKSILNNLSIKIPSEIKKIPIHGDISHGNLIFRNNKLVGVIDLSDTKKEYAIKDIARFISSDCTKKNGSLDTFKIKEFLEAYMKIRKLSKSELKLIPISIIITSANSFCWGYYLLNKYKEIKMDLNKVETKLSRMRIFSNNLDYFNNNKINLFNAS